MNESDVVVKAHPEYRRGCERNDLCEILFVGDASLLTKRTMLGKIEGDIGIEGAYDILLHVELVDEVEEDLSLLAL